MPEPSESNQNHEIARELLARGWGAFTVGPCLERLQSCLPEWLSRQRWFGAKSRTIASIEVADFCEFSRDLAIFFFEVHYISGEPDQYQVPLALSTGTQFDTVISQSPNSVVMPVMSVTGLVILHDATVREDFRQNLLSSIEDRRARALGKSGSLVTSRSLSFETARGVGSLVARIGSAEQSNTSILYENKLILKLFRRLQPGPNPDVEIGHFLTEVAHFPHIAAFVGDIVFAPEIAQNSGNSTTLAMLQELVPNEGDGWEWTLNQLSRFYESVVSCSPPADPGETATFSSASRVALEARKHMPLYLAAASLLGKRTAELHLALAAPTDVVAIGSVTLTSADIDDDLARVNHQINLSFDALQRQMSSLNDATRRVAVNVLSRREEFLARAHALSVGPSSGLLIRIHGDYHLGQVLRSKDDFVLLDFEGEPARSLMERRRKQCPLKDVAGMLRSFSYAAWVGLFQYVQMHPGTKPALESWRLLWEQSASSAFLEAYWESAAANPKLLPNPIKAQLLLDAYLLDKALYELLYELNNRPEWVYIPLTGILSLSKV